MSKKRFVVSHKKTGQKYMVEIEGKKETWEENFLGLLKKAVFPGKGRS